MKTLVITLAFAIGVLAGIPARAGALSYSVSVSASVALNDTIALAKQKSPLISRRKLEILSFISFLAAIASIKAAFSMNGSVVFLLLAIFSVVMGSLGLARIRRSQGRLGGRLLAKLGIIVSVTWLMLVVALSLLLSLSYGR